jgi:hypothetical protein
MNTPGAAAGERLSPGGRLQARVSRLSRARCGSLEHPRRVMKWRSPHLLVWPAGDASSRTDRLCLSPCFTASMAAPGAGEAGCHVVHPFVESIRVNVRKR